MTIRDQLFNAMEDRDLELFKRIITDHPDCIREVDGTDMWLYRAVDRSLLDFMELLIELGIDVNEVSAGDGPEGPIKSAAAEGHTKVARWLLDHGAKINYKVGGITRCFALSSAARNGHLEVVKLLVERGADINATWAGMNALAFAQSYGKKEIEAYLRSKGAKLPWELTPRDLPSGYSEIRRHVAQYRGAVRVLLPKSEDQPFGVCVAEPSKDAPWRTVFTIGLSDEGIKLTNGNGAFIEFVVNLPTNWPLTETSLKEQRWNWPIEWLRKIAHDTIASRDKGKWPAAGSIVFPNGDPPQPLSPNTPMTCWLGLPDRSRFSQATLPDTRLVDFCTLFPIYTEERDLLNEKGSDELVKRFQMAGIERPIDPQRKNVAK